MVNSILERSTVRIACAEKDEFIGVGFLMPDGRVMTCAHVVAECLVNATVNQRKRPEGTVRVDFPIIAKGQFLSAHVDPQGWRSMVEEREPRDIAVLNLEGAPPEAALPIRLGFSVKPGQEFRAFGMPDRHIPAEIDPGTWAPGRFTGAVAGGLLELQSVHHDETRFIRRGFSGAAAWATDLELAFGMVTVADQENRALAVPASALIEAWPALAKALVDDEDKYETETNSALVCFIDRRDQCEDFEWGLEGRVSVQRRPLLFVTAGPDEEAHWALLERFAVHAIPRLLSDIVGRPLVQIEWPGRVGEQTERCLRRLVKRLADTLKAASQEPEELRAALNSPVAPCAFYSVLSADRFTTADAALVRAWLGFWNDLCREPPGFARDVILFLCLKMDLERESELLRFYQEQLEGYCGELVFQSTDPLQSAHPEHIEPWFTEWVAPHREDLATRRASIIAQVRRQFDGKPDLPMERLISRIRDLQLDL